MNMMFDKKMPAKKAENLAGKNLSKSNRQEKTLTDYLAVMSGTAKKNFKSLYAYVIVFLGHMSI